MPHIGLVFELNRADTALGQEICVVGSLPELGAWDEQIAAGSPRQLHTSALRYPGWSMLSPVILEFSMQEPEVEEDPHSDPKSVSTPMAAQRFWLGAETIEIEYKYVKHTQAISEHGGPSYEWEDKIPNRRISVPKVPGAIWVVSDAEWDSKKGVNIMLAVDSRFQLHQEHMASIEQIDVPEYCLTETGSDCSQPSDIEDQFESLAAANDFATEAPDLTRENGMLKAENDSRAAEIQLLQQEIERMKAAQAMHRIPDSGLGC